MKTLVTIITYNSEIRVELLPFLADAARDNAIILPIVRVPIDVGRNKAIAEAQRIGAEVCIQLDADMQPAPGSYAALLQQVTKEPCVAACPYTGTGGAVTFVPQDLQAKGISKVQMTGLAVSAFNMELFGKLTHPYFEHDYSANHAVQTNTEDGVFCKSATAVGIPLYVLADHWATHLLVKPVGRPEVLSLEDLMQLQGLLNR